MNLHLNDYQKSHVAINHEIKIKKAFIAQLSSNMEVGRLEKVIYRIKRAINTLNDESYGNRAGEMRTLLEEALRVAQMQYNKAKLNETINFIKKYTKKSSKQQLSIHF